MGLSAKTDALGARVPARFGGVMSLRRCRAPSHVRRELAALVERRRQVVTMPTRDKYRLKQAGPLAAPFIAESIRAVDAQRRELEDSLKALLRSDKTMAARLHLLTGVKGVSPTPGATPPAVMPEPGSLNQKQAGARGPKAA